MDFAFLIRKSTMSMSNSVLPLPLIHALIGPEVDSMTLMLIFMPLAFVAVSACPGLYPKALLFVVDVLAGVSGSAHPGENTLAVFHPMAPVTVVFVAAGEGFYAVTLVLAILVFSLVMGTIRPRSDPPSMDLSTHPLALKVTTVLPEVDTRARFNISVKLAFITVTIYFVQDAFSLALIVGPVAFVRTAICIHFSSVQLRFIITPISFVDSTVCEYETSMSLPDFLIFLPFA